jgi:hypothetical protein
MTSKKYFAISLIALVALLSGGVLATVNAQVYATMPTLYNQSGQVVNNTTSYLPAGYYYIGGAPSMGGHQVQYYGNGTYYDPSIQQYGGSVSDPNGTAGVSLGYVSSVGTAVGLPNTGIGGSALFTWTAIIASILVVFLGVKFLATPRLARTKHDEAIRA